MRTTRIVAAATALPALTIALLIPMTAPAAAAPIVPATTQTISGDCEVAADLTTVTGPTRVEVDREVPTAHTKGFADAGQLAAGAYGQTRTDAAHPDPERCGVQATFTNALHVLPTATGPAVGTPVTVVATIALDGELDSSLAYTDASDALTEIDAEVSVQDPNAICNEGCADPLSYRADGSRRVWHSQSGGLNWQTSSSWTASAGEDWPEGGSQSDDGQACASFGCPGGVPGENSGGLPSYDIAIGTKVVAFPTHVGAVLQVRGLVRTWTTAQYGTTTATSDAFNELQVSFAPGEGSDVELHVGQLAPVDTVAPETQYDASPAPNAAGWNSSDVTVTLTATDNTAVTAFTYSLDGGATQNVPSNGVIAITTDGEHALSWAAKDAGGNTTQGSRTIRIDRVAPVMTLPPPIARPADASGSATVHYAAGATDDSKLTPAFSCSPASGSAFPVGNTFVQCVAKDAAGNEASGQFLVSVTEPDDVYGYLARLRDLVTRNPMDEILRKQLLNDLVLLEKAYEKGRGSTKGCKELGDFQLRVTTSTSIESGTKQVILTTAGELGELLGC